MLPLPATVILSVEQAGSGAGQSGSGDRCRLVPAEIAPHNGPGLQLRHLSRGRSQGGMEIFLIFIYSNSERGRVDQT